MSSSTNSVAEQPKNTVHLEETTYKCRCCDKTFGEICDRDNHEKKVHRAQECDICFKIVSHFNLAQHKKTVHFKQKPFKCQFCDKTFGRRQHWTDHENIVHHKQKQHKCRFCNKKFGYTGHRNLHEKAIHLKQKPYKCRFCNKNFGQAGHRNSHEKAIHLKQKPLICRFCDKTFGYSKARIRHEKEIHEDSTVVPAASSSTTTNTSQPGTRRSARLQQTDLTETSVRLRGE